MDATSIARGLSIGVTAPGGGASAAQNVIPVKTLNAPTMTVQSTASPGDTVAVAATTNDSDGATTTGVQLIDNGALLGSFSSAGGGNWTDSISTIGAGTHTLIARRQTAQGNVDSAPHVVTAASAGVQGNVQVKTDAGPSQNVQVNSGSGLLQDDL